MHSHVDWLFSERVVGDAILQLAANWAADYRTTGGIVLDEADRATVAIEDSSRVDLDRPPAQRRGRRLPRRSSISAAASGRPAMTDRIAARAAALMP
jgi:hypothetical protein